MTTTPRATVHGTSGARERPDDACRGVAGEKNLTPAQFATARSVSASTVRNWINAGVIHATRVGPRLISIPATEIHRVATPIADR
jgi:excisionase family DNA binding protein